MNGEGSMMTDGGSIASEASYKLVE